MSKIIKSSFATNLEKKVLEVKVINDPKTFDDDFAIEEEMNNPNEDIENQVQSALLEAENIRQKAAEEYAQVQQQINEAIAANEKQAEQLYRQAEENGYNDGFQQGLQEGQKQYEGFINEAKSIVHSSRQDYIQRLEESEPMIVELALKVAERIIPVMLDEDHDRWTAIVKEVLKEVRELEQVKVYVHPTWYEQTLAHKSELQLQLPNCEQLYIYPDVHLEEQGCVIETPFGRIDATVDTQLTELKRVLHEKLKELSENESR